MAPRVHDVEIGTPVMAAGPGQRRPPEDGGRPARRASATERSSGRPARSCMGRSPRNLPFQMASCRSKSRKLENATRSMPSAAAAARIARNGATTSLCKAQRGSASSDRWLAGPPGELIQREFRGFRHAAGYPTRTAARPSFCGTNRHCAPVGAPRNVAPAGNATGKMRANKKILGDLGL